MSGTVSNLETLLDGVLSHDNSIRQAAEQTYNAGLESQPAVVVGELLRCLQHDQVNPCHKFLASTVCVVFRAESIAGISVLSTFYLRVHRDQCPPVHHLRNVVAAQVDVLRTTCAVLIRRIVVPSGPHWDRLDSATKASLRAGLLSVLDNESSAAVARKVNSNLCC